MNLQNIPSHAVDIRHMFRATPGYTQYVDCLDQDDDDIVILQGIQSVYMYPSEEERKVSDLSKGDTLIRGNEHSKSGCEITDIEKLDELNYRLYLKEVI